MAKEYRITTLIRIYSNGVKKRKDIEFSSNLCEALNQVDFSEKDLEYVNILGYIVPAEGGYVDLYDEEYYIGEVVDKSELTDYEIAHARCCHHDFIHIEDVAGFLRAESGKIYMFLKGNNILNPSAIKEKSCNI